MDIFIRDLTYLTDLVSLFAYSFLMFYTAVAHLRSSIYCMINSGTRRQIEVN